MAETSGDRYRFKFLFFNNKFFSQPALAVLKMGKAIHALSYIKIPGLQGHLKSIKTCIVSK